LVTGAASLRSQPAEVAPTFESVKIKSCGTRSWPDWREEWSRRELKTACMPLDALIDRTYAGWRGENLLPGAKLGVEGLPEWAFTERFRIEAKAKDGMLQTSTGFMMHALLADRFKLKLHREAREEPAYALAIAEDGVRLRPAQEPCATDFSPGPGRVFPRRGEMPFCGKWIPAGGGMHLPRGTIVDLIQLCTEGLGRLILNETGLDGTYDFQVDVGPTDLGFRGSRWVTPNAGDLDKSHFPRALQKLGLRLISTTGKREHLVIDGVERPSFDR
jgi:uncharacterized protein (TIGR03435 family)